MIVLCATDLMIAAWELAEADRAAVDVQGAKRGRLAENIPRPNFYGRFGRGFVQRLARLFRPTTSEESDDVRATPAGPGHGLDHEMVVLRLRELVGEVDDVELMDAIYCAVDEVLERIAPRAESAIPWRELEEKGLDADERARATDALVAAIDERAVLRPLAQELGPDTT